MTEVWLYMMEKRTVYRLHLLKSFDLPLSYSSYSKLRLALSWAWNIRVISKDCIAVLISPFFLTALITCHFGSGFGKKHAIDPG